MIDSPNAEGLELTEILGPEAGRYFGHGYRDVNYGLRRGTDDEGEATRTRWSGCVGYPVGWSRDSQGQDRALHLASVDAIVLAVGAWKREAAACGMRWLADCSRLSRVRVIAGSRPWLDLSDVPVTLSADFGSYIPTSPIETTCHVGGLRVCLEIAPMRAGGDGPLAEGLAKKTVYGDGFRGTRIMTTVEKLDPTVGLAETAHQAGSSYDGPPLAGLDSGSFPALCAIDHLVTMGQVTQAVALRMMRRARTDMGNMWMRSLELCMEPTPALLPLAYGCSCQIERATPRRRRSGRMIHALTARLETTLGATGIASLAYETQEVE